jgi:hypothetical protein
MASLILDHIVTDYLYLGNDTERKVCSWDKIMVVLELA